MVALWPSIQTLREVWHSVEDYKHGYVIVAIATGWFAVASSRVWAMPVRPSLAGMGVLVASLAIWMVGYNANSVIVHQMLVPVVVCASMYAAVGWSVTARLVAPVAFLYFAVPVWEYALPTLQQLSVSVSETMLGWIGVPAQVHENTVTIPEGTFQIIEGCSGKRYFMIAPAIGMLAAAAYRLSGWRFAVPVVGAALLAPVANWLRIVTVIYAGHVTDMQHYLVAKEHATFGNIVFGLLIAAVILLANAIAPRRYAALANAIAPRLDAALSLSRTASSDTQGISAISPKWAAVSFALLLAVFAITQVRANAVLKPAVLGSLPLATGKWQGPLPPRPQWQPAYVQPDAEVRASYSSAEGSVEVYANGYGEQHQGRELVYFGNTLLAPGLWHRAWPPTLTPIGSAKPRLAAYEATAGDGSLWLVAYTYEVGGWAATSEPLAQLGYGVKSFLEPAPSGVIAFASRCDKNCETARILVTRFWDDMSARMLGLLPDDRTNP
jgi:EpsI family protein